MGRRKKVTEEEISESAKKIKRKKLVGLKTIKEIWKEEQIKLKELKINE